MYQYITIGLLILWIFCIIWLTIPSSTETETDNSGNEVLSEDKKIMAIVTLVGAFTLPFLAMIPVYLEYKKVITD